MSMTDISSCPECGAQLDDRNGICAHCLTAPAVAVPGYVTEFDLPGFRLERVIGAGGMGVVYVAEEEALGRRVAVKTIQSDRGVAPELTDRFDREARLMATVEDPNVVRVYSSLEHQGRRYIVMEYVEGESLADRLARGRGLPIENALRVALQVAFGLRAAAAKGVVHRDVKPANILIDMRDNVRVTDFGLSRSISAIGSAQITQEGRFVGTPAYVAPEQAAGLEVDLRADVYGLGIVMYQMLAGEVPFKGSTPLAVIAKHLNDPIPQIRKIRREVPTALQKLVERMTAKEPDARPPSWDEVIDEIRAIMRSWAPPVTLEDYARMRFTFGSAAVNAVGGALLVVALFMTWLMMSLGVNLIVTKIFGDEAQRWVVQSSWWMPISLTIAATCTAGVVALTLAIIRRVARRVS